MDRDFNGALRDAGLRVTAGRVAVLSELRQRPHLGVGEITASVRARTGTASTQAVYDVLAALHGAGLIRRVEPAGQPPRYELQNGDNHHHLMCRSCGAMHDVACSIGHSPCLVPSNDHGFVIDEAEVIYWGLCADCNESKDRNAST